MKITDIKSQKKNDERLSVFVDDEYAFSLEKTDALRFGLKIGMDVSSDGLKTLIDESNITKAKKVVMNIISRKSVTKKTVVDALLKRGFDNDTIETVVDEISELGYINDYEFVLNYAKDAIAFKHHGPLRIEADLRKKGADRDLIKEILSQLDFEDTSIPKALISTKFPNADLSDYKTRAKIFRFLATRGYTPNQIYKVFGESEPFE